MSHLTGNEPPGLHFWDGSHNWVAPEGVDREEWRALVEAHQDAHRERPDAASTPWRRPPPPPE
jgi:hypothetical protein